jgi:hypothetical protein
MTANEIQELNDSENLLYTTGGKTALYIEPIVQTFQKVKPYLATLSPAAYNFYKDSSPKTSE